MRTEEHNPSIEGRGGAGCLELEPLLAEYVEGSLSEANLAAVETHLAACAACRELAEAAGEGLALCRRAAELAPPPGLVARIIKQTSGRLPWRQRIRLWVRPVLEPRLALGMAMALISFSVALNHLDVDVRQMSLADLRPSRLYQQAERRVYLASARAVKYYRDLKIVYEIQTQLQAIRDSGTPAPAEQPREEKKPPQNQRPDQPQPPAHNRWSGHSAYFAFANLL